MSIVFRSQTTASEVLRIDSGGNMGIGTARPREAFWITDEPYKIVDRWGPEVLPGWTCIRTMDFDVQEFIQCQSSELWRRCADDRWGSNTWVVAPKLMTLLRLKFSA